jgi:hypothetical protein
MYKVGDKVLCQTSPNLWKEGVILDDSLKVGHWWVDMLGESTLAHERDLKPRTSPNELTVIVNIDASGAIAELDGLGELITQRVKAAVAAGLAGETADLVRERDALREELAACKRERDATVTHLEGRVNDLTWERDEARQKLAHAQSDLIGCQRERDEAREGLDAATASLDDYATGMGKLAAAIRKARGEGL